MSGSRRRRGSKTCQEGDPATLRILFGIRPSSLSLVICSGVGTKGICLFAASISSGDMDRPSRFEGRRDARIEEASAQAFLTLCLLQPAIGDAKQCRHHKDLPCHSSAALS
jgi:hypothetical protein